ncbi:sulfoxide reductase heme-binding subunit YedZ [Rhodoferax lacus]|uniref:Protein-methionine-sulfoxide reductase heme-binding subunit MsrQ n=2 Tax=Rhodoferax lacus TaxID=2184758 RepID=A0A3E1RF40_9BURK|nr:sulfoxide reductase heme-binding subunit YedZ [Rhodoferax lacus]
MLAAWLKNHFQSVWRCCFSACMLPALALLARVLSSDLGPNPLALLLHTTGRSALVLLTATLAITPLRRWLTNLSAYTHQRYGKRLSDWNWLVRLRRLLGLSCFAYALAHAWIFAAFDLGYDWSAALSEVQEKPYVLAGLLALLILAPLAATSTQSMVRRLGRHWRRLHRLSYAAAVLGLLHFWWLTKPGLISPWPDTAALTLLLGYRAALYSGLLERWDGFDGKESLVRPT